ncbi:MAG: response regulator, partial [Coriobacteriales bacterium]|nr:response regulator [Coriobacteriales bacterium]
MDRLKDTVRQFAWRHFQSDELPLDARVINIVSLIATIWTACIFTLRVIQGYSLIYLAFMLCAVTLFIILNIICIRRRANPAIQAWAVVFVVETAFPITYFFTGAMNSGFTAAFVLSTSILFFLLRGRKLAVMLVLHFSVIITLYTVSFLHPEYATWHEPYVVFLDNLCNIIIAGCIIGVVDMFQNHLYRSEHSKVEKESAEAFRIAAELAQARDELLEQERLLSVVNQTAQMLLNPAKEDLGDVLYSAMAMIGSTMDLDRLYIWRGEDDGEHIGYRVFSHWVRPELSGILSAGNNDRYAYFNHWKEQFLQGKTINGPLATMPSDVRDGLAPFGIKSLLIVPVFQQDEYWGFVSFDDCHQDRYFAANIVDILRSASFMLVSAVSMDQMDRQAHQALEEALRASQAKADFLSNMSHEIRTPMNAIIGMTAIGREADNIARKDDALDKIDGASAHLLGVINDILDMSKIEARKLELFPVRFNFAEMIDKVMSIVDFSIREHGLQCRVDIDPEIPPILYGDDQRLAQVVTNLMSNAVKFTPEGGRILLSAKVIGHDGLVDGACALADSDAVSTIRVSVRDTGIGIDPDQQKQLFSSFHQAESGIARKYGGTGLGLSISKNIIEMMGGRIWLQSEPGQGSTFSFEVPLQHDDNSGQASGAQPAGQPETGHPAGLAAADTVGANKRARRFADEEIPDFSGHQILLAEDVEVNQEIVAALLEKTNIRITMAANGLEALEVYAADPARYELIFMDVQMPEMDG